MQNVRQSARQCKKFVLACIEIEHEECMVDQAPTPAAVLARELSAWRRRTGLTAQQLAERIAKIGGKLTRQAISKIENEDRGVAVDELFLLARGLNIPPAVLLFPIGQAESVEVLPGAQSDPWTALLWFIGREPDSWMREALPVRDALKVMELVDSIEENRHNEISLEVLPNQDGAEERRRLFDESDRARLRHLAHLLGNFPRHQVPAPPVPAYVVDRASELCIELPERQERPQGERPDQGD